MFSIKRMMILGVIIGSTVGAVVTMLMAMSSAPQEFSWTFDEYLAGYDVSNTHFPVRRAFLLPVKCCCPPGSGICSFNTTQICGARGWDNRPAERCLQRDPHEPIGLELQRLKRERDLFNDCLRTSRVEATTTKRNRRSSREIRRVTRYAVYHRMLRVVGLPVLPVMAVFTKQRPPTKECLQIFLDKRESPRPFGIIAVHKVDHANISLGIENVHELHTLILKLLNETEDPYTMVSPEPFVIFEPWYFTTWYQLRRGLEVNMQMMWGELLMAKAFPLRMSADVEVPKNRIAWLGGKKVGGYRVSSCSVERVACDLVDHVEANMPALEEIAKKVVLMFGVPWLRIDFFICGDMGLKIKRLVFGAEIELPFLDRYVYPRVLGNFASDKILNSNGSVLQDMGHSHPKCEVMPKLPRHDA